MWTLVTLVRRWRSFWSGPLTAADRALSLPVAFFLVIPISVLLHETGHALATWSVGGTVEQFSWRVYWGFIVPAGDIGPLAGWWIALAGNLVGIAVGLVLLLVGARGRSLPAAVRAVALQAGLIDVVFAAVGYPLLSAGGRDGDWAIIYDFHATPVAAGAFAAIHLALLIGLWWWWTRGRLAETLWAVAHGSEAEVTAHRAAIAADPGAVGPRLALVQWFLEQGDAGLAAAAANEALRAAGDEPALLGALGTALLARNRPAEAAVPLMRAVAVETGDQRLWANLGIALAASGRAEEAREAFARLGPPLTDDPAVRRWRDGPPPVAPTSRE